MLFCILEINVAVENLRLQFSIVTIILNNVRSSINLFFETCQFAQKIIISPENIIFLNQLHTVSLTTIN